MSLWIKTACRGKALTSLDHTIRAGNSIVAEPSIHPRAFDWQAAFPQVFAAGGFDVVVGNPPYVRQELLGAIKPYLEEHYAAYHGMADLYVDFYELGLNVLKPGGLLSFIVTNKWMKAGYGEPLRTLLAETSWIESVVDFGHAKQIFEDADVFPSIIVARKPATKKTARPKTARLCSIPREQLRIDDLSRQIAEQGTALPLEQLSRAAWQLEPGGVAGLLNKIRTGRTLLTRFVGAEPIYGLKTGCNEAFLIDTSVRNSLVAQNPHLQDVIHKALRGQDVDRWQSSWDNVWMIRIAGDQDIDRYGAVKQHLSQYRQRLEPKPRGWKGEWSGRASGNYQWYELQSGAGESWKHFLAPKIVCQEIQFHLCYALDNTGCLMNSKVFMVPSADRYLLGVLNSPLMWRRNWRYLPHMKDEALSPAAFLMKDLPIAEPTDEICAGVTAHVERLLEITASQHDTARTLLDWLKVEHAIEKPMQRLQAFVELDSDGFVTEIKKIRGRKNPLSAAAVKHLRDEFARSVEPAQALAREAVEAEHAESDLVSAAYGLTPDEIDLMWATAPPRMPIARRT